VERRGGAWETVDSVKGGGTVLSKRLYAVTDSGAAAGTRAYRIKEVDLNGSVGYSQTVSFTLAASDTPARYLLEQNYPNPFNPGTTLRYSLPVGSFVTLSVFNPLGQIVASLVNEEQEAGVHEVRFASGNLSSGVYYYRLKAGKFTETKELLLIR
jgi:hypothetical protein